jgi:O-antigen/teichoic acid export membrane protein
VHFITGIAAHPSAWWIVAGGLGLQSLSQLAMGVFQAHSVVWRATVADILGRIFQLLGIFLLPFIFASTASPITVMAAAFTLGTLVAAAVLYYLLPLPWRARVPDWRALWPMLRTSWPFVFMLVLNAVYFRVDMLILTIFRSSAEVGVYGLAYRIIESGLFIPAMFGGLLLPHLSRLRTQPAQSTRLLNESLRAAALAAFLVVGLLIVLARPLIVFFSGNDFLPAASLLVLLSLALLAMFFGNIFGYTLVAYERQRSLMWLYLALAAANLLGNLLLIPKFGALAAAATTVVTELAATVVAGILTFSLVPYSLSFSFLVRLLAATLATVATAVALPDTWHVIIQAVLATAVFGLAAFWLQLVGPRQFPTLLTRP